MPPRPDCATKHNASQHNTTPHNAAQPATKQQRVATGNTEGKASCACTHTNTPPMSWHLGHTVDTVGNRNFKQSSSGGGRDAGKRAGEDAGEGAWEGAFNCNKNMHFTPTTTPHMAAR